MALEFHDPEVRQVPKANFDVVSIGRSEVEKMRPFWYVEIAFHEGNLRLGLDTVFGSWSVYASSEDEPFPDQPGVRGKMRWEPQRFGVDPIVLQALVKAEENANAKGDAVSGA